jgi:hypothetical protein
LPSSRVPIHISRSMLAKYVIYIAGFWKGIVHSVSWFGILCVLSFYFGWEYTILTYFFQDFSHLKTGWYYF